MTKLELAAREVIRQHSMECLSDKAIAALRQAASDVEQAEPLMITPGGGAFPFVVVGEAEQAEQEPVAWRWPTHNGYAYAETHFEGEGGEPLYTAPLKAEQEPVAIGDEWKPCMKLPIVVHVREQREGETHVSTREGITPILPTDLIMRGVAGEEYPIGYELFNKTYTFEIAAPIQPVKQEPVAWHEPNAYGNVTTHKKWAEENGWLPLYTKE